MHHGSAPFLLEILPTAQPPELLGHRNVSIYGSRWLSVPPFPYPGDRRCCSFSPSPHRLVSESLADHLSCSLSLLCPKPTFGEQTWLPSSSALTWTEGFCSLPATYPSKSTHIRWFPVTLVLSKSWKLWICLKLPALLPVYPTFHVPQLRPVPPPNDLVCCWVLQKHSLNQVESRKPSYL